MSVTSRSTPTAPTSVPPRSPRAPRSPPARACRCSCSARPREIGDARRPASRSSTRPVSIAKARRPGERRALDARGLDRAGRARGRRGRGRGARLAAARPAPRWPRACSTSSARRGIHRPALAIPLPVPGTPVTLLDVGANAEVRARAPRAVRLHGRGARRRRCSASTRPRVGLLSNGEEATKGTPLVVEAHAALRERVADGDRSSFVGNVEGNDVTDGARRRDRHRRLHRQRRAEAHGGRLADDARARSATRRCPRARGKAGRPAAAPALRELPRRDRPRGRGRRLPARPAPARRRAARALHAARLRPGDPAGRARRPTRTSSGAPTRRSRPRARCAAAPSRPRAASTRARAMTRERGLRADPGAPRRRARASIRRDRRGDALQGGPRGRLARPLHARAGARGLLRREDVRRAGRADPRPWARPSTSSSPTRPARSVAAPIAARLDRLLDELPEDLRRQVFTHASWTERRSDSYSRLAFLGDSVLGAGGHRRTSTRAWRPSATAPGA